MIETCNSIYGQHEWMLMQDGAPCHNAHTTLEYLKKYVKIVPGWPPNSPDLNPIEIIWAIIKRKLKKETINPEENLIPILQDIWKIIDEEIIIPFFLQIVVFQLSNCPTNYKSAFF